MEQFLLLLRERDNPVSFELLSKNWYDHSDLPYGVSSRAHCVFYA